MPRTLLGLMIALLLPVTSWAAEFSESFDCTDSASLNCNLTWTELGGTAWQIVSNNAIISGNIGGWQYAFPTSLMTTDYQFAEGVLHFAPNGTNSIAIGVTCQRDVTAATLYEMSATNSGAAKYYAMRRHLAGAVVDLVTDAQDPVENDVVRIECRPEGANMRLNGYVNGVLLINVLDSTSPITGNRRAGLVAYTDASVSQTGGWKSMSYGDLRNSGALMLLGVGQ